MDFEVKDLVKSYGDLIAVNEISFRVKSGEIFSILGRNGSGKTSLIRSMLGIIEKDSGSVLFNGKNFHKNMLNNVGYIAEERGLFVKDTVERQLVFLAQLKGMSKKEAKESVDYWVEKVGLTKYKRKMLDSMSKGNQQKIQIIAALLHDPDFIILDEPFSGLDPVNAEWLIKLIRELSDANKGIIVCSHQLNFIEKLCDRLVIVSKGKALYSGTFNELEKSHTQFKVVLESEAYLGTLSINNSLFREIKKNQYEIDNITVSEVAKFLVNNNFNFTKLQLLKPSLHEIFVKITEGD